jgi:TPP-dependent pyruvate/acetoin dehydrogenase alpha subunit
MAGVALAMRTLGKPFVGVALMGAKSLATGDFHEGLNLAAVQKLPLIVIVENDPRSFASSSILEGQDLYERMKGYGVPAVPVDGADILQVLQVMETAMERAKKGPTVIEARTSHMMGYTPCEKSVPFPFSAEDLERGDSKPDSSPSPSGEGTGDGEESLDPVAKFEAFLVDHALLQPVERGLILNRIEQLVRSELEDAEASPLPQEERSVNGVYAAWD